MVCIFMCRREKMCRLESWSRSRVMSGCFLPTITTGSMCILQPAMQTRLLQNQVWLMRIFPPPPHRLLSWRSDCGPCKASGCTSHTPSAAMRRWLPTSLTRTAAGTGRPVGGEQDQKKNSSRCGRWGEWGCLGTARGEVREGGAEVEGCSRWSKVGLI